MSLIEIKHNGNRDATATAPDESAVAELREAIRGSYSLPATTATPRQHGSGTARMWAARR